MNQSNQIAPQAQLDGTVDAFRRAEAALRRLSAAASVSPPDVLPPHELARLARTLAFYTYHRHAPRDRWERHAGADEPIYRMAHTILDELIAGSAVDGEVAHANLPGMMWTLHRPHRFYMAKDTYVDRQWWADRFREYPYLDDGLPAPQPQGTFTLFRGAPAECADGLTWTPASRLASKYGPLWTITVPGEALLYTFRDRTTALTVHVIAPDYIADPQMVDAEAVR